jgi:formaldehyde-activating enzyme involved in methanogenesis
VAELAQGGVVEYTFQIKLKPAGQAPLLAALRTELDVRDARLLLEEASLEY